MDCRQRAGQKNGAGADTRTDTGSFESKDDTASLGPGSHIVGVARSERSESLTTLHDSSRTSERSGTLPKIELLRIAVLDSKSERVGFESQPCCATTKAPIRPAGAIHRPGKASAPGEARRAPAARLLPAKRQRAPMRQSPQRA